VTETRTRRVLFVAYYFPPMGGSGVERPLQFVKHLRRYGWEPTVLTAWPDASAQLDETLLSDVPRGAEVIALASDERLFRTAARLGLGRLSALLFRPDAQVMWARRALAAARRVHGARPFDLVFTTAQPWSAGLVGLRLKEETGLPWVSDFRDPWTRSLHLAWPTRRHWRRDLALEGRFLAAADRTLAVTPTMRDEFLADHADVDARRVEVLYNGFDEDGGFAPARPPNCRFTIVFAGRFRHDWRADGLASRLAARLRMLAAYRRRGARVDTHSPVYFLRALSRFLKESPERRVRTRVVFAGVVGKGNKALIAALGLGDVVECVGRLPRAASLELMRSADALLLPMFSTDDPRERVAYASGKIFEYMSARRPILALTQEGDAKDLALASGLGIVAAPDDVGAIAAAIERLYNAWESGAPVLAPNDDFISRFSRAKLARRLAQIFDEVLAEKETHP